MSITFEESLLSLGDAAKTLPNSPHISTVWRWVNRGVRGVVLETIVIAGRRFTSREALQRFVRLEKSRSRPGSGLGLSLVAAVARLHGGSIRLEDNAPGLKAVLTLPMRSAPATPSPVSEVRQPKVAASPTAAD